jgi:hypothetical protein
LLLALSQLHARHSALLVTVSHGAIFLSRHKRQHV